MRRKIGLAAYWIACVIAGLEAIYGLTGFAHLDAETAILGSVIPAIIAAAIVWGIGRAALYLLANR